MNGGLILSNDRTSPQRGKTGKKIRYGAKSSVWAQNDPF
jgi:hypothetical protein